jgi:hypothetical protein
MPLKNDWGLQKVGQQMIMDFGFERIMMNHIASELISIIAQEQKMFENQHALPKDRLTTHFIRSVINNLAHIVNSKIEHGIQLETVQKKQGSSKYFLKITGDPYLENRLTPWALDAPEEYQEPGYTWLMDNLTGIGSYVFKGQQAKSA